MHLEPDRIAEIIFALAALLGGQEGIRYVRKKRRTGEVVGTGKTAEEIEAEVTLKLKVKELEGRLAKLEEE